MSLLKNVCVNPSKEILEDMQKEDLFFLFFTLCFSSDFRSVCYRALSKAFESTEDQNDKELLWLGMLMQWGACLEDLGAWCLAFQKSTRTEGSLPVLHSLLTYQPHEADLSNLFKEPYSSEKFLVSVGFNEAGWKELQRQGFGKAGITYAEAVKWFGSFFVRLRTAHSKEFKFIQIYNRLKHAAVIGRDKSESDECDIPIAYYLHNSKSIGFQKLKIVPGTSKWWELDIRNIAAFIESMIRIYVVRRYPDHIKRGKLCVERPLRQG